MNNVYFDSIKMGAIYRTKQTKFYAIVCIFHYTTNGMIYTSFFITQRIVHDILCAPNLCGTLSVIHMIFQKIM